MKFEQLIEEAIPGLVSLDLFRARGRDNSSKIFTCINFDRPVLPGWHVNSCHVDERRELCVVVVLEERDDGDDSRRVDQDLQLVASSQLDLLDELGQTLGHILAKVGQVLPLDWVELAHRCCNFTRKSPSKTI